MAKARRKKLVPADTGPVNAAEVFDQVIERVTVQPEGIVHGPSSLAPEREAAHENGHSALHAPHRSEGQSHADAVGRRPRYTGQGKTDYVVGAKLDEHQNPYLSVISFKEKPSAEVREFMKQSGFTWQQGNGEWTRPIHFDTRVQDRLHAERTFEEACHMTREERGITHSYGSPS